MLIDMDKIPSQNYQEIGKPVVLPVDLTEFREGSLRMFLNLDIPYKLRGDALEIVTAGSRRANQVLSPIFTTIRFFCLASHKKKLNLFPFSAAAANGFTIFRRGGGGR